MRTAGPVGFDLDLTLINSRPAIMAAWSAVAEELGVRIDLDQVDQRMGINTRLLDHALMADVPVKLLDGDKTWRTLGTYVKPEMWISTARDRPAKR